MTLKNDGKLKKHDLLIRHMMKNISFCDTKMIQKFLKMKHFFNHSDHA